MAKATNTAANAAPASTTLNIKGRMSYVHVFEPTTMVGSTKAKYSVCILIPKSDTEQIAKINAAIKAAEAASLNDKFKGKIPVANFKRPLRDGDTERPDNEECKGMFFINASSNIKPGIVDANREAIQDTTEFYSGCYGRANVNFYGFNTNGNMGIACGLNHVQKLEEGEALGGRGSAESAFDDDGDDIVG